MSKPIIEIKVNNWNMRTREEQDKALEWLLSIFGDLTEYRKSGISNKFIGKSK